MTTSSTREGIASYIRDDVIAASLKQHGCMVVYDPDRRYRELCLDLRDAKRIVVDATESSLESRQEALHALRRVGDLRSGQEELLVYVPAPAPVTPEERQADPFALYAVCGAVFPDGDADAYEALCLRARPDHATAIRKVFEQNPNPSFAIIDAIGTGSGWPLLKTTLRTDSPQGVLAAVLAPTPAQKAALGAGDDWVAELRDLCRASLGLELKTRSRKGDAIADEMWRFLLFSEFARAFEDGLPGALASVPHAPGAAAPTVTAICEQLRRDERTQSTYMRKAEEVEKELGLPALIQGAGRLTPGETFPLEDRLLLERAVDSVAAGDLGAARGVVGGRSRSLWRRLDQSAAQWALLSVALDLMERCEQVEGELPVHAKSAAGLVDFYTGSVRDVDRLQREMEQSLQDLIPPDERLLGVAEKARGAYRRLVEKVQAIFVRHLEADGWPLPGRLALGQVFDRFLGSRLQESGRRVACILVDALRYELGVELQKQLLDDGPVDLHAACAALPSITLVGMASLLPGAHTDLRLGIEGDTLVPTLGGTPVRTVSERMQVLQRRYGDRFHETTLSDFIKPKAKKVSDTVNLLVLRSVEIDSQLENNPDSTLTLVPRELRRVRAALHRLREQGFEEAVIATDHGFFLNTQVEAGDVCAKPSGNWLFAKDRSLLGTGSSDAHNLVLPVEKAGIRGDFAAYACPRTLAPFRNGLHYFHSGASLQELVVPVLVARLAGASEGLEHPPKVTLSYRQGAKKITTLLPAIDVTAEDVGLFAPNGVVEILLEARDGKDNVVGEARRGETVNPATGTISLKNGHTVRVTLKMDPDFEGRFTVKAVNPVTLATYEKLNLETDYTV